MYLIGYRVRRHQGRSPSP